jgi:transposase, IS30 family
MAQSYRHLTYTQRCQICALKERGDSSARIALSLGVHRSTISRELKRNQEEQGYQHEQAHLKAQRRKRRSPNQKMSNEMIAIIEERLRLKWSPEQISGWMKRQGSKHVSYETIYKHVWMNKKQGGLLYQHLRHHGKKYNKRSSGNAGRGCIPGRIDIKERPSIVDEKTRLGDWELDTIIGANHNGVIVSMVDRTSKLTKLVKVPSKESVEVEKAIINTLIPFKEYTHTLTADNGKEFARHQSISKALGADFYFATPYHSWERGLNEHTNGLVRQYFPKGMNFHEVTDEEVGAVEAALNSRPRKILSFETPAEAFHRLSCNR